MTAGAQAPYSARARRTGEGGRGLHTCRSGGIVTPAQPCPPRTLPELQGDCGWRRGTSPNPPVKHCSLWSHWSCIGSLGWGWVARAHPGLPASGTKQQERAGLRPRQEEVEGPGVGLPTLEGGQEAPSTGTGHPTEDEGGDPSVCAHTPPTAQKASAQGLPGAAGGGSEALNTIYFPSLSCPKPYSGGGGGRLLQVPGVHGDSCEALIFQGRHHGGVQVGVHEVGLHVHRVQVHAILLNPKVPHQPAQHGPGQAA